jgi:hypothetical protein
MITGTNFISASMVTYNGVAHTATFVSSTQLTIILTASDQATAGTFAVVVTNPKPGGGASNAVNFTVSASTSNPVPTISSLSPSSALAGSAAQTLTITGTNFISASVVTYNGVAHTATFVSSTELTIMLSASDQATAGTYPVVVTNPSPGGGASSAVDFTINAPNNVLSLSVNLGPTDDYANGLFASVEVCEPGSTTNCTTVPDVLVDTGSTGLRLLSGAVGVSLPPVTDSSGNDVQECIAFISLAYIWGPVVQADIHLSGETASSASIHIISETPQYPVPSSCIPTGPTGTPGDYNSVSALGANGILGVANFAQDCGSSCAAASNGIPQYFSCPSGNCQITSVPATATKGQVWNPVALFPQDNNGVLISMPSVAAGGAATAAGSLIFGIGTQTNNALGSAQVYGVTDEGYFTTTYNGTQFSNSFIDTGSNAYYFLDSGTLGGIECADNPGWYCPSTTLTFNVTNAGTNGTSGPVSFNIENADALFNTGFAAFNDLGGDSGTSPSTDYFDFGMPFFFGRNVFVGIAGQTVTGVTNAPYGFWAY